MKLFHEISHWHGGLPHPLLLLGAAVYSQFFINLECFCVGSMYIDEVLVDGRLLVTEF